MSIVTYGRYRRLWTLQSVTTAPVRNPGICAFRREGPGLTRGGQSERCASSPLRTLAHAVGAGRGCETSRGGAKRKSVYYIEDRMAGGVVGTRLAFISSVGGSRSAL